MHRRIRTASIIRGFFDIRVKWWNVAPRIAGYTYLPIPRIRQKTLQYSPLFAGGGNCSVFCFHISCNCSIIALNHADNDDAVHIVDCNVHCMKSC